MINKRLVLIIAFAFLFSITQVSHAKDKKPHIKDHKNEDVGPVVEITSPADGTAIRGNLLQVEVSFGNVKTVLLKMDGEIVGTYENHPTKKEGIHIFNIDISGHPDAIVILQAFAVRLPDNIL